MAEHVDSAGRTNIRGIDQTFLVRTFYVFIALALASALIATVGRWLGPSISMGGYSDDPTLHEIVIGNNVLSVPANAIRFAKARHDGVAARLDLYLHWPDLGGYSDAARADFNGTNGRKDILFLSFEPQTMSHDMSGRLEPIYRSLIVEPGISEGNGITLYDFKPETGYLNEVLAVGTRTNAEPFVARCLAGAAGKESLAPCQRDVLTGNGLSLNYRFPRELLADWQSLDAAVTAKARSFIRTAE
ncbi:hypothetical protein [Mesorhizobium koreense]|uniref:hypothetical protein n=1 Tax=Mesorhizobium koreense TaxID=3074855 RepID=UPI00287B7FA7|nr:hypothetical protein [Mesorhizobium sp. WR6]